MWARVCVWILGMSCAHITSPPNRDAAAWLAVPAAWRVPPARSAVVDSSVLVPAPVSEEEPLPVATECDVCCGFVILDFRYVEVAPSAPRLLSIFFVKGR